MIPPVIARSFAPLLVAYRRARWGPGPRELRRMYRGHLEEMPRSLEERVAYHFEHLEIYWRRITGWAEHMGALAMYSNAQFKLILALSSPLVSPDVEAFCAKHRQPALRDAWNEYLAVLRGMRFDRPDPEAGLERGHAAFQKVREIQRRFELPAAED